MHIKQTNAIAFLIFSILAMGKNSNDGWNCSCVESTEPQSLLVGIGLQSYDQ